MVLFLPVLSPSLSELINFPGSTSRNKYRTSSLILKQRVRLRVFFPPSLFTYSSFTSVTALEKLHAKHVLPGFTDRSLEEREIEGITTDITKVSQPSSGHLPYFSADYLS
jgi:hypothetical protein